MLLCGSAKKDITYFKPGVGMMGFGMWFNIVKEVETPLLARAYVFIDQESGKKVAFVNAEICFITVAIKRGVMKRLNRHHAELNFHDQNVMLTAQHTHSGPGGYSHYGLYNMSVPGFMPENYATIVDGIADAIIEAHEKAVPAKLRITEGEMPTDREIAFNRSIEAWNLNPEVPKYSKDQTHLAFDKRMTLLLAEDLEGKPLFTINWFGIHTTSVPNYNTSINADNKGYAATWMEEALEKRFGKPVHASFAQRSCGDISPNFVYVKERGQVMGKFKEDYLESAKYNGKVQFEKAQELVEKALGAPEILPGLDAALCYVKFAETTAYPEFANGNKDAFTSPPCQGVAFFEGTAEGPGMAKAVGAAARGLIKIVRAYEYAIAPFSKKEFGERIKKRDKAQGTKEILIESGERKIMGTGDVKNFIIPGWADRGIAAFKRFHANGSLANKPWTPLVLPLQIFILGEVAIVGVPGELTTVAGWRLEKTILDVLSKRGVKQIILSTYCNAYHGYVTTYEEYQIQCYEGGHTVYGQYTLAAFQSRYKDLAEEMLKPETERNLDHETNPVFFTEEELAKRTYDYRTQEALLKAKKLGNPLAG